MSTIPSTFRQLRVPYTVVAGNRQERTPGETRRLSLVLLNRGGRFNRVVVFHELERMGFDEIISIEGPAVSYEVESLSRRFSSVRFLLLHDQATRGEQVNLGIEEATGRSVFVLWNDMRIGPLAVLSRLLERMEQQKILCISPLLQNARSETVPSVMVPAFYRNLLRMVPLQPVKDGAPTLFPFDYCGIYQKELFSLVGGYDFGLRNPYWQKMDFGFRSHMWGERIISSTALRLSYEGDIPSEDTTPDASYKMFHLKNLAVRFSGDQGILPNSRFLPYLSRSGSGPFIAYREFRDVKRWVALNRYRFRQDARSVTELWEAPDES